MTHWTDILACWFGAPDSPELGCARAAWFRKSEAFDRDLRARFGAAVEAAASGALHRWHGTPLAALALVITLDQFPRNIFRDTARAFAADPMALAVAQHIVDEGFDGAFMPVQRWFAYLPFEHAEDLAMQDRSVALFERLAHDPASASPIDFAHRHRDVIVRFGRFPHRNAIVSRASTPAEIDFLKQPGAYF